MSGFAVRWQVVCKKLNRSLWIGVNPPHSVTKHAQFYRNAHGAANYKGRAHVSLQVPVAILGLLTECFSYKEMITLPLNLKWYGL